MEKRNKVSAEPPERSYVSSCSESHTKKNKTICPKEKQRQTDGKLSEYEALRLRNMARNAAMLADIGIDAAVSSVSATQTPKGVAKPVK